LCTTCSTYLSLGHAGGEDELAGRSQIALDRKGKDLAWRQGLVLDLLARMLDEEGDSVLLGNEHERANNPTVCLYTRLTTFALALNGLNACFGDDHGRHASKVWVASLPVVPGKEG
jgi:hypothetical protein